MARSLSGAFLLIVASCAISAAQARDTSLEDRLKAAVLSKFPAFTEWPAPSLEGRPTIDLCVAQPNPFGTTLADLVAGVEAHGRALRVREVQSIQSVDTCHVLFIPAEADRDSKALLTRAARHPVLTVGDDPMFLDQGGMVQLRFVRGRVRFDIDMAAAGTAGIQLSSQLLRLALSVRGGP